MRTENHKDILKVLEASIDKIWNSETYGKACGKIEMANYLGLIHSNEYCQFIGKARSKIEKIHIKEIKYI